MTRASLDESVFRASRQRPSSSPVIRHKALTARRIDASARHGSEHWLGAAELDGAVFFASAFGASGLNGDAVDILGGVVGAAFGGGGGGAASLAGVPLEPPPSAASAREI